MADKTTGSTTTQSSNPAVNQLVTTLTKGYQGAYQPGGTTYVDPSQATKASWEQMFGAAGNKDYSGGIAGALKSYGNRAAGNEIGVKDPLYAQQRATTIDDVLTAVNGQFNSMGQLGSDQSRTAAARGLTQALGGLDTAQRSESYGLQDQALRNLMSAFQGSLSPASVTGAVGSAQDADAKARQLGALDYQNAAIGGLSGLSGAAGTTTKEQLPWWRVLFGGASTAGGLAGG